MTSYTWKHLTAVHLLGWGNSFSEIVRNNAGIIVALNPMHPEDVKIEGTLPSTGALVYSWTNRSNQKFMLSEADVLHIRYMSFDGIIGCSPILHLKQLVGRSKAREEFQSRFYANGAQLGGVITMPGDMTDEQFERHRKSFEDLYKGPKNAGKMLILEGSQQYHPISINPKDAEFIDTSKLDAAKIAAAYGVPLQLINDIATTTRASSEQLFREFLMLGLNTVFTNIEAEINMKLFSEAESITLYHIPHRLRGNPHFPAPPPTRRHSSENDRPPHSFQRLNECGALRIESLRS
jgi:HK97 family phage portal protein